MTPPLVSIVVPTLNASGLIKACLDSIVGQEYAPIELIVVDGYSSDDTLEVARTYTERAYLHGSAPPPPGVFSAPAQRNSGASKANGKYLYYVDADMVLPPSLIHECVMLAETQGADAVIVPEKSFGTGFWSRVKAFERSFYEGDDFVEAPRFVRTEVWNVLGGLDPSVGGNDDWDFHIRLRRGSYRIVRASQHVLHNEGNLSLRRLARKRYVYGRYVRRFVAKYGFGQSVRHFDPIRRYVRHKERLIREPWYAGGLLVMRTVEYTAGAIGLVVGRSEAEDSTQSPISTS